MNLPSWVIPAFWIVWSAAGIATLLPRKLNEQDCSLLDIILCVVFGIWLGWLLAFAVYIVWPILGALHQVKIHK